MSRARPADGSALPTTDWRATVVLGPPGALARLADRAVARRASVRAVALTTLGDASCLALPQAPPSWWLERPWGGVLVRAAAGGDLGTRKAAHALLERALAGARFRPAIPRWQVPDPVSAALVCLGAPRVLVTTASTPLPPGPHAIETASVTIDGLRFDLLRFVRAGAQVEAAPAAPAPTSAGLAAITPSDARRSRALRWRETAGGPWLLVDAGAARAWRGVADERGPDAYAAGRACDYERATRGRGTVSVGRARALVLPAGALTWLDREGWLVQLRRADDLGAVLPALSAVPDGSWKRLRARLTVGRDGAVALDAAETGSAPRDRRVLQLPLRPGAHALERARVEATFSIAGRRATVSLDAWRFRPAR